MDPREFSPLPAEFSTPPPEGFEEGPASDRSLNSLPRRGSFDAGADQPSEMAPLPPEFGQSSGPQTPYKKNRKYKKWLYAMAVILVAALANGSIGGSSSPAPAETPVIIEIPGSEGDPQISIDYAYYTPAASSDYSIVEYSYSLEPNETDLPIRVYVKAVDRTGKEAAAEDGPDIWRSAADAVSGVVETTGLAEKGMKLVLTAEFERDGETRQVAVSKAVERETFPDVSIEIEYAKYVPKIGNNPAFVGYSYKIKTDDDSVYPISVYSSIETESGYIINLEDDPVVINKGDTIGEYQIPASGLSGDLTLNIMAEFECRSGTLTIFEEEPVDMSARADEPEEQTWPLGDGSIVLTVYNNTFSFDMQDDPDFPWMEILLHETIAEADWEDITLPEPIDNNEDWTSAGYVLHYGNEFDYGYSSKTGEPFIKVLDGDLLTREDIELIPPSGDGNRYVNVHVMWYPLRNYDFKLRLELDLNDGTGDAEVWEADQPFASEGVTYLAVFDEPWRDGYTFTGWYDEEGNKVEYLTYYDFFDLLPNAQSNEDRDWEHAKTIRLYAGWEKD